MNRKTNFAGSFYPDSCDEIESMFQEFNETLDKNVTDRDFLEKETKSVIVPHAGYIYSGINANIAYRTLVEKGFDKFLVVGPCHRFYFEGVSVGEFEKIETPLGDLECDSEFIEEIKSSLGISLVADAHIEHSTEVQFPFLKYYFPESKVVEIVYGKTTDDTLEKLMELAYNAGYCVVISTDLSHFHNLDKANKIDSFCLEGINTLDIEKLQQCEACGKRGVISGLHLAKSRGLKPELLYYSTSFDRTRDKESVVGYLSTQFYKES